MMDCVFANGSANVWETGPFPSQALQAGRVECRHPSRDPWTAQSERKKSQRVATGEKWRGCTTVMKGGTEKED